MKRVILLAVLVASCSSAAPSSSATFDLEEYRVYGTTTTFSAGPVAFDVDNEGEFSHTFVITAADGSVVTALDPIAAGESRSLTVDLAPGTYQVSCRIVVQLPDGTIVDHYQQGMHALIHVEG